MTPDPLTRADCLVIGGGIVGLASARAIAAGPGRPSVVVVEKEAGVARHQSGRNSGVIHSGIYYREGSLRARNCRRGVGLLLDFCRRNGVEFSLCGKVVVASVEAERSRLEALFERGRANGVPDLAWLDRAALREIEPRAEGVAAIHSPTTGVIRYRDVAEALARRLEARGGRVVSAARVVAIAADGGGTRVETTAGEFWCRTLVSCAGLHADRVARLAGDPPGLVIAPFRGEFFRVRPERSDLVRGMIYPTPDPRFPFLGVHIHRTMDGGLNTGPNAVLAGAREGYRWRDARIADLWELARDPGLRRLVAREWRTAAMEVRRSLWKPAFVRSLQRLVPELEGRDLERAPAGVRAIAVTPDGRIVDDFRILRRDRRIHVLNAPSPAATASLAIGERVAALAARD